MNPERRQLMGAAMVAGLLPCRVSAAAQTERWAFGYFKNHDEHHKGLRLAISADGLAFDEELMSQMREDARWLRMR